MDEAFTYGNKKMNNKTVLNMDSWLRLPAFIGLTLVALFFGFSQVTASTIRVPSEYGTIQAAIDISVNGDTILVAPGTYTGTGNRELRGGGDNWWAVIISESGAENTIIDCEGSLADPYRALYFDNYNASSNVIIDGFTFRNGYKPSAYSGIMDFYNISPTIRNCVFENNIGSAVFTYTGSPTITDCTFRDNFDDAGAGLYAYYSSPIVTYCLFYANTASAYGGGAYLGAGSHSDFKHCTFVYNSAKYGAGININAGGGSVILNNCLITNSSGGGAVYYESAEGLTIGCCNIYGNNGGDWTGVIESDLGINNNISTNPYYCADASGNFYLTANSPCAQGETCTGHIGRYNIGCSAITLSVVPSGFYFQKSPGVVPSPQSLSIDNLGGSILNWSAHTNESWLGLSDVMGTAPFMLTVSVNTDGLIAGEYTDVITVYGDDALDSPAIIPVTLVIGSPPYIHTYNTSNTVIQGSPKRIVLYFGESFNIGYQASDPNGTIPAFSAVGVPSGAIFVDDGDGTADLTWDPVTAESGIFLVDAIASDGILADTMTFELWINHPPEVISACGDTILGEGETYSCHMVVQDIDDNPVTITWNGIPSGASFIDNSDGTADFSFIPNLTDTGSFVTVFEVSDSWATTFDTVIIQVENIELSVTSITPTPGTTSDILITEQIQIEFNQSVEHTTLTNNVTVTSSKGTILQQNYNTISKVLSLTSSTGVMIDFDTISVTLGTGILDLGGGSLDSVYVLTFITGAGVYPGDCNNDGIVDERDVLPIGLYYGNSGPSRERYPDCTWELTPVHIFNSSSRWSPLQGVYADADGSGLVDAEDICGIADNWGLEFSRYVIEGSEPVVLNKAFKQLGKSRIQDLYDAVCNCKQSEGRDVLKKALSQSLEEIAPTSLPTSMELYQNYPNPFNSGTVIRFYHPSSGKVSVSVYNVTGQKVAVLIDGTVEAGYTEIHWDGTGDSGHPLASGIYFYRLEGNDINLTKRMILLK